MVTHQGIAFDVNGVLVDGQHRLAAVIEADVPVELTVFTEVGEGTFDVLDTGKRRTAADVLAIEGGEVLDDVGGDGAHRMALREPAGVQLVWWGGGGLQPPDRANPRPAPGTARPCRAGGAGRRRNRDDQKRRRRGQLPGRQREPARRPRTLV